LNRSAQGGEWTFLSNCHLSIALLPELESMMDQLFKQKPDKNFRLFLSASPHPDFPISLLQRSLLVAQEPPRGIKANMLRLYTNQSKAFTLVDRERDFRKAVFGLSWFHSILIERKKFKTLGWNVSYAFNDSDYNVSEDVIALYMGKIKDASTVEGYKKGDKIKWDAIQYLIAECNYGGRITDERDRRLIKVYAKEIFDEGLIAIEKWRPQGTEEFNYVYPVDEAAAKFPNVAEVFTPPYFLELMSKFFTDQDPPIAFGQHTNAEITSQIMDSNELLSSILSL
jgi:dynein heavy chain